MLGRLTRSSKLDRRLKTRSDQVGNADETATLVADTRTQARNPALMADKPAKAPPKPKEPKAPKAPKEPKEPKEAGSKRGAAASSGGGGGGGSKKSKKAADKEEEEVDELGAVDLAARPDPAEGAVVVVIHPGSTNLRIGRAENGQDAKHADRGPF